MLGVAGELDYLGRGISTCATCDGFFYRDRKVAVVGGGDSALEEALFLTRFASSVVVVHRRNELRASKILQSRASRNPKLSFCWDNVVVGASGSDDCLDSVDLENVKSAARRSMAVDGLFITIGHRPNSEFVRDRLVLDSAGYIVTEARSTRTSEPGIFACGDVQDSTYRQAVTAAGPGCMAALDVEQWLIILRQVNWCSMYAGSISGCFSVISPVTRQAICDNPP
jgi:thioredoxin reductase (NADPH)